MALYGRTYTLPMYKSVVIEAASQEEADRLYSELEKKWRYLYRIARQFLGDSDARDECDNVEFVEDFDGNEYGYDAPTFTDGQIREFLNGDE